MVDAGDCRDARNSIDGVSDYLSNKTSIRDLDDDPADSGCVSTYTDDFYSEYMGDYITNYDFSTWLKSNTANGDDVKTLRDELRKMLVRQNFSIMKRQEMLIKQNSAIIQRQDTLIKVLKAQTRLIEIFAKFYIDTQYPY